MMNSLDCPSCHSEGSLSKLDDKFFEYDAVHWIILKCRVCQKLVVKQYVLNDIILGDKKIIVYDEEHLPIELKTQMEKYKNSARKALNNLHEII
jgi:hypothetical protein